MNFVIAVLIGIFSGFVASLVFIIFFSKIRPSIDISDKVSYYTDDEGKKAFMIKIINRSRRPVVNLKAELELVSQRFVKGGAIQRWKEIDLVRPDPMQIEKYDEKDIQGMYAFRFRTFEDIDQLWTDEERTFLRFRVMAIDPLSGFSKVFVKNYYIKKNTLVQGDFAHGDTFQIS